MRLIPLTLMLAISGFHDTKSTDFNGLTKIKPNDVTRMAFNKNGYEQVQFSNKIGPVNDGMLDVIDAIKFNADQVDIQDADCAIIARVESTRGMDSHAVQKIGEAIEAYMTRNRVTEFATAAIADINEGQELHGKWNTLLLVRDFNGAWTFKNLRFTSVQKCTDDGYGILRDGKMNKVDDGSLISTLLDDTKLQAILDGGYKLEKGKHHLVRAPINKNGAYSVVGDGLQTVYNDQFEIIASGKVGFVVMPTIDVDGTPIDGQVTTVSVTGNTWDVRKGIPARKADSLGQAYGATA